MKLIPHHQDDKYGPREYRIVQRQLLLPLDDNHFCRFRSSWIEIDNGDASGVVWAPLCAVQSGVEARASRR